MTQVSGSTTAKLLPDAWGQLHVEFASRTRVAPKVAPSCPRMQVDSVKRYRMIIQQKIPRFRGILDYIGFPWMEIWWRRRESNPRPSIRHAPATTCLVCLWFDRTYPDRQGYGRRARL